MSQKNLKKISILTATLNASFVIQQLIDSLLAQSNYNFEWVVADGGSDDGTIDLIKDVSDKIDIILDSRKDRSISDAINRAISLSSCDYFIIVGADDFLFPDAVQNFLDSINKHEKHDIFYANVMANGVLMLPRKPSWVWLYGTPAIFASTAIGTLYNKETVVAHGCFDPSFQIYADGYLCLKIFRNGGKFKELQFNAGVFAVGGISNNNQLISYTEDFRAKVLCGYNVGVQAALLLLRVLKFKFFGRLLR